MIKYSYIKLTGCLVAAALAPLCTSAQRIDVKGGNIVLAIIWCA